MGSYHNGGIQRSRTVDGLPMQKGGNPATTPPGGNNTLVNQNEAEVLDATIEDAPFRQADVQEDDSHVQGIYRETEFAGS